jgi:predicted ATPase
MSIEDFREAIQRYCREVDKSQKTLAQAIGLHPSVLSNKLNGTKNSSLMLFEIKLIVQTLASWRALTTRTEVSQLLATLSLDTSCFTAQEWATPPLKQLEVEETPTHLIQTSTQLPTLPTPAKPKHNLPAQLTTLVGREHEIKAVTELLSQSDVRLVTLTGPGGVGKTRLALSTGTNLVEYFEDGVFFVGLAAISEQLLVTGVIAQALGLKEQAQMPPLVHLKQFLYPKHLLLVLDNFEQVLEAAEIVAELLEAAPHLKILITSRMVLHLYGEYEFVVSLLPLPQLTQTTVITPATLQQLAQNEAVALFVQRAKAVKHDFNLTTENATAVVDSCKLLDGLPLAIELVAARIKLFTPVQLLEQLVAKQNQDNFEKAQIHLSILSGGSRTLPLRHQTLRNALDWSYNLLTEQERNLFIQLAVFVDGFTAEAVSAVCFPAEVAEWQVVEQLASLVDQSLLQQRLEEAGGTPGFTMLGTIHEYALEKLTASGTLNQLRQQHMTYYGDLAEKTSPKTKSLREPGWFKLLQSEHANFRAALRWMRDQKDFAGLVCMCEALWLFWEYGNYSREARYWLELALSNTDLPNQVKARLLLRAGTACWMQGDFEQSKLYCQQSLKLYQQLEDKQGIAEASSNLALTLKSLGDVEQARQLFEQSLSLYSEFDTQISRQNTAASLNSLGTLLINSGEYIQARNLFEQSLTLFQDLGDKTNAAGVLLNLGNIARHEENFTLAQSLYDQSLTLFRELGMKRGIGIVLKNLGQVAQQQQVYTQALTYYQESLLLRQEIDDKSGIASSLNGLASLALDEQSYQQAAQLYAAAETLRNSIKTPLIGRDLAIYQNQLTKLQTALDQTTLAEAWVMGAKLSLEQAITLAFKTN